MHLKIKWTAGTVATRVTTNQSYTVVGWNGANPIIIGDNGELWDPGSTVFSGQWDLVPVSVVGPSVIA